MSNANRSLAFSPWQKRLIEHFRAALNGIGQLSRSPWASLLTFAVIGITLALPLALSVVLSNMQIASNGLYDSGQINLYLKSSTSQNQINDTMRIIQSNKTVASAKYISPQDGFKSLSKAIGFTDVMDSMQKNPLPGVITILPQKNLEDWRITQLFTQLKQLPAVDSAQLDMQWLQRLHAILNIAHRIATLLTLVLAFAVILIIANTLRLTTQNHHDEILVTKLIGGTNQFIRRPFLYSGIIYGLAGAIFAWFLVDILLIALQPTINQLATSYGSVYHLRGLDLGNTFLLLVGGMLLGFIASYFSVNRYIRQIELT